MTSKFLHSTLVECKTQEDELVELRNPFKSHQRVLEILNLHQSSDGQMKLIIAMIPRTRNMIGMMLSYSTYQSYGRHIVKSVQRIYASLYFGRTR